MYQAHRPSIQTRQDHDQIVRALHLIIAGLTVATIFLTWALWAFAFSPMDL